MTDVATARASRAPWWGVGIALLLVAASMLIPWLTGTQVFVDLPPLHATWAPRFGPGTVPAVVIAILAIVFATRVAERVPWWGLLLGGYAVAVGWLVSLATVDGLDGIGVVLDLPSEYLGTARSVTDIGATLHEYVSRIPRDSDNHWPVHLAGHPPGALLFFFALVRLGLGSGLAAGWVVVLVAATTPIAVLLAVRRLGTESLARRAAPFLVLGPAAIWMAVSADAMFAAVAAWGLCALAAAATSRRRVGLVVFAVVAGLLLGYCVLLSYGLPLLGVLAIAVLVIARSWWALPWAVLGAAAVVIAFALAGFAWWEAYSVLVERYWAGIASDRPLWYWIWADFAALVYSAGPIVGAAVAVVVVRLPSLRRLDPGTRAIVLLTTAALVSVVLADLSGMSRAEVERIWLPFVPWLLLGTALLSEGWRRGGLALQLVFALLVQHLFATTW